ncbi:DUF397 domain-containing protein [Haloactinomyces albus]|uniref:DUF397 domain-containing protein n=1 Tax=Haloactinomyces albus TaxID=1352928 RepID=A0AAE3ZG78_9ACTN|nr:DUF397 domain-containing protein [Haloactinomyces albus]MDR7303023.1 hypothetical protein [Haloactinomyces albus]
MPAPNLTGAAWRKSTRSNANNGNCVEVGFADNARGVRDTKDRSYGTLAFGAEQWSAFVATVKSGRLDPS